MSVVILPRSSVDARPQAGSTADLALMRQLDTLYLQWPFSGSHRLCVELQQQGSRVTCNRSQRLLRKMGRRALDPKPRTSQPGKGHKIPPYLLRGLSIERANQVWASDICYISMAKGFRYLMVIIDWYSRRGLAWRVSNTLETDACVEALEEALLRYGAPEIFKTDQGVQYTSEAFIAVLKGYEVKISTNGQGRWVDNVVIERLWRSVKYEAGYLHADETPAYNTECCPQALNRQTPDAVYVTSPMAKKAA